MSLTEQLNRFLKDDASKLLAQQSRVRIEIAVDNLVTLLHKVVEARHIATITGTGYDKVSEANRQFLDLREETVEKIARHLKQPELCDGCGLASWDESTVQERPDGKVRCADCEAKR